MTQKNAGAERRAEARIDLERPVTVIRDGAGLSGTMVNLSRSGMLFALAEPLTIWTTLSVALPGLALREARVVRRDGDRYGLVFREPLAPEQFAAICGLALPEPAQEVQPGLAPRIAPISFGRDRVKTFHRRARELASHRRT